MKKLLEIASHPAYEKALFLIAFICCLVFLLTVAVLHLVFKVPISGIDIIVGAVVFAWRDLFNFKWGSSSGSKDKDDTIKNMLNNKPD